MRRSAFFLPVGLFLISKTSVDAKAFLESGNPLTDTAMSDMMATLLSLELPEAASLSEEVRAQHAQDSHAPNQAALKSMFTSLPKNELGNLGLPAARYALHRLFEHRHRWFVRGLHPKTKSMLDRTGKNAIVGNALQRLAVFDQKGVSLPDLAALAGTLEKIIHGEVALHLAGFYENFGYDGQSIIPGDVLMQLVDAYMTIYIAGADFRNNTKKDVMDDNEFMAKNTKDWAETKDWVRTTTSEVVVAEESCKHASGNMGKCSLRFNESARIVGRVVEKYGYFNDRQCHKLKAKLIDMTAARTGRVKLADFYKAGLSGAWEFNEKIDYLRSLGALDESTEDDPKVIVPNYVSSWVNCLSSSEFYSVCCPNECEDYMQVLEKNLAAPWADPDKIMQVVETQPKFTGDVPRNPGLLRHRLVSIAERHHGRVHIHGRLFAQWMHHAFPQTCPYPHEDGKTNPQTPDEWMMETGHVDIKASKEEVHEVMRRQSFAVGSEGVVIPEHTDGGDLPWSDVEELLVVRPAPPPKPGMGIMAEVAAFLEGVMVMAAVCAVIWAASYWRQLRLSQRKEVPM